MGNRARAARVQRTRIRRLDPTVVYRCPDGHATVTRLADHGTPPASLGCRTPGCGYTGHVTDTHRSGDGPARWEWYRPTADHRHRLRTTASPLWDHVRIGGMLLRPTAPTPPPVEHAGRVPWPTR